MRAKLTRLRNARQKYKVVIYRGNTKRTIRFGQAGASDYTKHRDEVRKQRYLARHAARENWQDEGSAGFWSRWLLWNKQTIRDSKKNISDKFGIKFI